MKSLLLPLGFCLISSAGFGQDLERFYNTSSYLYGYKDPGKGWKGELKPAIKAKYVEAEENGFKNGSTISIVRTRPKGVACCDKDQSGVIDKTGTEIIPIGSVKAVYRHVNSGYIMMRKEEDDKRGLMHKDGRTIFPAEYKLMSLVGNDDWLADTKPIMLKFGKDGKYGLMQLSSEKKTPMHFENVFTHGYQESYAVKQNGKWAFINFNFEEITAFKYTAIGWSDDNVSFWCELGGTKKLINAITGKEGAIYTGEKPKEYSGGNSGAPSKSSGSSSSKKNEPAKKEINWACAYCSKSETRSSSSGSPSSNGCTAKGHNLHMWRKQ